MKQTFIAATACAAMVAGTASIAEPKRDPVMSAKRVAHAANESSSGLGATETMVALTGIVILALVLRSSGGGAMAPLYDTSMTDVMVSDQRLKTDITHVGTSKSGVPIYTFRYGDAPEVYTGVMAQDLATIAPDAVVPLKDGYFAVDYSKIDVEFALAR